MNTRIINTSNLEKTLSAYAGLTKKASTEVVREVAKRFARIVLKMTPPFAGGGKRKTHTDFLKKRIKEMRLPRGRLSKKMIATRKMSKKEATAYYRVAVARQGELLSGWNAVARAAGLKTPAWIARHGEKHGAARERITNTGSQMLVSFSDASQMRRRNDMRRIAASAVKRTESGLRGSVEHILRKKTRMRR
ncbi:MAG: hypothetical protein J6L64_01470 [Opitutales bacterium]|nr:hypothetical protein [Opitutales bacterium]